MYKILFFLLTLTINSAFCMEWGEHNSNFTIDLGILTNTQEQQDSSHEMFYCEYEPLALGHHEDLVQNAPRYNLNSTRTMTINPITVQHNVPATAPKVIAIHKPYVHPLASAPKNTQKTKKVIAPTADTQLANYFNTLLNARHKSIDLECCERSITSLIALKNHVRSHHMTMDAVTKLVSYRCLQSNCLKCPYHSIEGATTHLLTSLYPDIYKCPRKNCHTILSAAKSLRSHFFNNCIKPLPDLSASNQEQS